MLVSEFTFDLPPELIAQKPSEVRDASRLMVVRRAAGGMEHARFANLPEHLTPGDVMVVNDTRVYPARLDGVKEDSGGAVEALLVRAMGGGRYTALMRGRTRPGAKILFAGRLGAVVEEDLGEGRKVIRFDQPDGLEAELDTVGRMPLPPYIGQGETDEPFNRERYQTVYADKRGAVAAPTAGLHFTPELMGKVEAMGVTVARVTLHVGIGTFMPVRVDKVEDHVMEEEEYEVTPEASDAINAARAAGGRIVAVGTTSARTLESAADGSGRVRPGSGGTRLFAYPGYRFKAVDALVTNFHLPKSTLLMLVSALAGKDTILRAYEEAVRRRYRFYSYGDAMFIC